MSHYLHAAFDSSVLAVQRVEPSIDAVVTVGTVPAECATNEAQVEIGSDAETTTTTTLAPTTSLPATVEATPATPIPTTVTYAG